MGLNDFGFEDIDLSFDNQREIRLEMKQKERVERKRAKLAQRVLFLSS